MGAHQNRMLLAIEVLVLTFSHLLLLAAMCVLQETGFPRPRSSHCRASWTGTAPQHQLLQYPPFLGAPSSVDFGAAPYNMTAGNPHAFLPADQQQQQQQQMPAFSTANSPGAGTDSAAAGAPIRAHAGTAWRRTPGAVDPDGGQPQRPWSPAGASPPTSPAAAPAAAASAGGACSRSLRLHARAAAAPAGAGAPGPLPRWHGRAGGKLPGNQHLLATGQRGDHRLRAYPRPRQASFCRCGEWGWQRAGRWGKVLLGRGRHGWEDGGYAKLPQGTDCSHGHSTGNLSDPQLCATYAADIFQHLRDAEVRREDPLKP